MYTKALARVQLLAVASLTLAACGSDSVSPVDSDANDSGVIDATVPDATVPDATVPSVDCDGQSVGSTERRVRYQAVSVPADGECMAQDQARVCGEDGTWTEWSGDYSSETCSVTGFAGCDDLPHGTKQTRDRYELEVVPFGGQCTKQSQSRECDDGAWTNWSGSYTHTGCSVTSAASCERTPHGAEESRVRYASLTVPHGSVCRSETQTRNCTNGDFSPWTGSLTAESCRVLDAMSCGNSPHGAVEKQTRFQATLVASGETCRSEEQSRSCSDGAWSAWSGTFTAEVCDVAGARRCGDIGHGKDEKRDRFANSTVPFGSDCVSERQVRTCDDGTWSEWSGTHTQESCRPELPKACDEVAHGAERTRLRFQAATVPFGANCVSQEQVSTCNNGTMSDWSGNFTHESCEAELPKACDDVPHGGKQTRTRFENATVPFGANCASQQQESLCNHGAWGEWTGSFTHESCSAEPPKACDDVAHGGKRTRTRFAAATAPFGASCESQEQESTCNNGTWSAFTGTYAAVSCAVEPPASCDGVAHGSSQTRNRFQSSSVAQGETCQQETQTRLCINGEWQPFSGTFTAETCRVRGKSCTKDFLTNAQVLDGESDSRVRFAAAFPTQACTAETQTRLCTNGTFGAWSGTLTFDGCAPTNSATPGPVSCRYIQAGIPMCSDWSGVDPNTIGCPTGTVDKTHGCPTGGSAKGKCVYASGGIESVTVYYVEPPASTITSCKGLTGATWVDL